MIHKVIMMHFWTSPIFSPWLDFMDLLWWLPCWVFPVVQAAKRPRPSSASFLDIQEVGKLTRKAGVIKWDPSWGESNKQQMDGNFEGFPQECNVWVGNIMTNGRSPSPTI